MPLDIKEPPPDGIKLVWVDPKSIGPNPENFRVHPDDQRTLVGDMIDDPDIGWADACLYNLETNEFIDGHLRLEHALKRGYDRIPVLIGRWSPEKQRMLHAALDLSAGMARPDLTKLKSLCERAKPPTERAAAVLRALAEHCGVSFDGPATEDGAADQPEQDGPSATDRIAALQAAWGCEPGQVWAVPDGERTHRIAIGDATDPATWQALCPTAAHLPAAVFTSPPYGDQREYDGMPVDSWDGLMRGTFSAMPLAGDTQIFVNLGIIYLNQCIYQYWSEWIKWMHARDWRPYGWYVWDQGSGLPLAHHGRLAPCFEFVFHFNKSERVPEKIIKCARAGETGTVSGVRNRDGTTRQGTRAGDGRKRSTLVISDMKIADSVVRVQRANQASTANLHPAVFPKGLPDIYIRSFSSEGEIIIDPFGGSGTTLMAAADCGRVGYMVERHPGYVAIVLERCKEADFRPHLTR